MYSFSQRCQYISARAWAVLICFRVPRPASSKRSGGGCHDAEPSKKCLRVKATGLLASTYTCISGRLFMIFSASSKNVYGTSCFRSSALRVAFSAIFIDRTSRSQTPPVCDAPGGM
ncbi:hypothetical protein EVAR_27671_1 [Eumeta japonica]|uniref:Uncharacterized protein n=1 Tax=Eumeta variegata TaxID=151549 RepID=A0A4C1V1T3_EUMVA|nr:hypothetical protein EVAR_27671_1 [Eumeta japonica]